MTNDPETEKHLPIFVYGTLKRGEPNVEVWPCSPMRIMQATTAGALYDLGRYPALLRGEERVAGEMWFLKEEDMKSTLKALDRLEGFNQGGANLYERVVVDCIDNDSQVYAAFTYCYLEPLGASAQHIRVDASGTSRWTRQQSV